MFLRNLYARMDSGRKEFMDKKKNLKFFEDWLPLRIDGCEVVVYFPSAYDTASAEARPEAVEQTLIAAYQKSSEAQK